MNATESHSRISVYELAALAAQICPELSAKSPQEAIKKARALLAYAWADIANRKHEAAEQLPQAMEELRQKGLAEKQQEAERLLAEFRAIYSDGIKIIASRNDRLQRLYLARQRFPDFIRTIEGKAWKGVLAHYEKHGFSGAEILEFHGKYAEWWDKSHKRAKQGRVADKENDTRLRPRLPRAFGGLLQCIADEHGYTDADVLDTLAKTAGFDSIRQPVKPITITKDEKAALHTAAVKHGWEEKLPGSFATREPITHKSGDRGWTKDADRPLKLSEKKAQHPDSTRGSKGRPPLKARRLR